MNTPLITYGNISSSKCPLCGKVLELIVVDDLDDLGHFDKRPCRHFRGFNAKCTHAIFENTPWWSKWLRLISLLIVAWVLLNAVCAHAYELVGPKAWDAEDFGHRYRREMCKFTKGQVRELMGRFDMLVSAAGETEVDWFRIGVVVGRNETIHISGPGALRFNGVADLGILLPDAWDAANWTDSAQYPLTINLTSDAGHIENGSRVRVTFDDGHTEMVSPIRLLVRVPKGTPVQAAVVDTSIWKGGGS